jgi:hypothetical protein
MLVLNRGEAEQHCWELGASQVAHCGQEAEREVEKRADKSQPQAHVPCDLHPPIT